MCVHAVAVLNAIALCRIGSRSSFVFVWCWGKRGRMADWSFGGMSMWSTWRRDINTWAPHMLFLTPGKVQLCNSSELENSQRDSWTSRWSAEFFIQRCNDCHSITDKQSMMTCGFFCSRPWLCYWILHSLAMLNQHYGLAVCNRSIDFLSRCQVSRLFPCPPPENCTKLFVACGIQKLLFAWRPNRQKLRTNVQVEMQT